MVELHLAANNLDHVLRSTPKSDPLSDWEQDNLTVNSIFTKTIHKSNMRYIRYHPLNAAAGWTALKATHQDSSAGGRVYWLRKLVLCRMEDNDVKKHIEKMNTLYEHLDSLITPSNPLTADNIHAAALMISLPLDWLPSVTHLLNQPQTTSAQIVTCLKNKSTRRSLLTEQLDTITALRAYSVPPRCSFTPQGSAHPIPYRTAFNPS